MVPDMRFAPFVAVIAAFFAFSFSPASAITNGTPDGAGHPAVGALVASKAYSDGTWAYCTGTLISPTVFLTAAHCGQSGQRTAMVSFAIQYQLGAGVYVGRYEADPLYTDSRELHDIAVVVFSTPIPGIRPARLPTAGMLDQLKADGTLAKSAFTPVGYGSVLPDGPDRQKFHYSDTRRRTSISFGSLTPHWLKLSEDAAKKDGGTCFGDSGGPNLLDNTNTILSVNSFVTNGRCNGVTYSFRIDTPEALSFINATIAAHT